MVNFQSNVSTEVPATSSLLPHKELQVCTQLVLSVQLHANVLSHPNSGSEVAPTATGQSVFSLLLPN